MHQIRPLYEPLRDEDIAAFEERTGIRLPSRYREFLKANNGGEIDPNEFDVPGGWGRTVVNYIFGIKPGDDYDIEYDRDLLAGRLPRQLLAIADDPAGNRILIDTSPKGQGRIYLWDHEHEPPAEACTNRIQDYPNIHLLAGSLDEFLAGLQEGTP